MPGGPVIGAHRRFALHGLYLPVVLWMCAALFAVPAGYSAASDPPEKPPLSLVDFFSLDRNGDVDISADGTVILYSKGIADWGADGIVHHLWVRRADGRQYQLTNGPASETDAKLSPDGRMAAFISKRKGDAHSQLYVIDIDGGEAFRLTGHPTAVKDIAWTPDSKTVLFRAPESQDIVKQARENQKDDLIRVDGDLANMHLWSVSALGDSRPKRLTSGAFSVREFSVGAGGDIVLSRAPTPRLDAMMQADLWHLDAGTGVLRQITDNDYIEVSPRLSPNGRQVAFLAQVIKPEGGINVAAGDWYYNRKLFIVPVQGGTPRLVTPDFRGQITDIAWSANSRTLFGTAEVKTRSQLYRFSAKTGKAKPLTKGKHSLRRWAYAAKSDTHVVLKATAGTPGDVYVVHGGKMAAITRDEDRMARRFALPRTEDIQWPGRDNVMVEGIVYYPTDFRAGQRYPLIVQTHGGPASAELHGMWHYSRLAQVYAGKGFLVLSVNYRGSTGYGDAYLRDMVGGYFTEAHHDVLLGVNYLIGAGLADPDALIKMGWSAGGHMTNKLISVTDRFKAAASGAGAANWISMYGQTDIRFLRAAWFGGTPWQQNAPLDRFLQQSPLRDVHKITTPTLFLVGERDGRVPPAQSLEMFRALQANGVPAALYLAPGEGHGWRRLSHQLHKGNLELEWFYRHALNTPYTWERIPGSKAMAATSEALDP